MDTGAERKIEKYVEDNMITARAYHKILRIARTVADFNNHDLIKNEDLSTAIKYRFLDIEIL